MNSGHRALLAATVALAAAFAGAPARGQGNDGSPVVAPSSPGSTGRPGTQGGFQPPAPIAPGQPVSVLVFPFGSPAAEAPAEAPMPAEGEPAPAEGAAPAAAPGRSPAERQVDETLTAAVKAGFLSTPAYAVATYHPLSSLVQRAKADEILNTTMLTGIIAPDTGAVDLDKAKTITYRLGMQTFLIGTVEMKQDAKALSAEVTVQTQLMDSTTGEVLRSAAVSGAAAGAEGVPMSVVRERAALDAAAKVLPAMGIELVQVAAPAAAAGKGKAKAPKAVKQPKPKKEPKQEEPKTEEPKKSRKKDDAAPKTARTQPERIARADTRPVEKPAPAELSAQAAPEPAKPAAEPAVTPATDPSFSTPITAPVKGTSNQAGQPIPYGYALGDVKSALPPRNRSGLKVPPWLGVAGFLAGISFLL